MMNGMGNMQNMMKQAQKMQKKIMEEQESLNQKEFTGVAPDEVVKATFAGDRSLKDLVINPAIIDPKDPDMLQDMVLAAVNDGLQKIEKETQSTMGKYTKGLPGF